MGRLTVRRGGLIRLALLALSWGSSFVWIKHGTGNAAGARRRPAPRLPALWSSLHHGGPAVALMGPRLASRPLSCTGCCSSTRAGTSPAVAWLRRFFPRVNSAPPLSCRGSHCRSAAPAGAACGRARQHRCARGTRHRSCLRGGARRVAYPSGARRHGRGARRGRAGSARRDQPAGPRLRDGGVRRSGRCGQLR